jgi:2-polyprenyl-3-methyl-5-hydroxy-6-metoxy-1,4-benzoquinol methylase
MAAFAEKLTADYDPIAWFYNQHSSAHYDRWALAMLECAIPGRISKGTRILNICCRDGVVARELALRGYQVTGIDGSEEMVRYARANAPLGGVRLRGCEEVYGAASVRSGHVDV